MTRWSGLVAVALILAIGAEAAWAQAPPPTPQQFVAQADAICEEANPRNLQMLKRARALVFKGRERKGGRLLIRAERFELRYYGEIDDLPETADPAFNELVDDFLRFQRGQARARIKVGRLLVAGAPPRAVDKPDTRAVRLLRKAGRVSREIGFTHC